MLDLVCYRHRQVIVACASSVRFDSRCNTYRLNLRLECDGNKRTAHEVTLVITTRLMKKRSGETLTPRAGCSKAEPKKCWAADPLHGCAEWPKFNQLEMVTTFTCRPNLVRIDSRNFEFSW